MGAKPPATFNPQTFLTQVGSGKSTLKAPNKQILFSQGDAADAVFYVQAGKVKLTVVSRQGKEAVVAMLEPGQLFRGRVSRRAAGVHEHGDRRGRLHSRAH
jgi:CRP/FNR family transcriptional regulator, cyclic AMP receptor protein